MKENIGHVLYHVLIVIFPVLIYYLFTIKKISFHHKHRIYKLFAMVLPTLLLTMSFPIKYANGFHFDFRVIPILIAFLYGSNLVGFITVLIMLMYRAFLGGPGLLVTSMNYTIAVALLILMRRGYEGLPIKKKVIFVSAFYWLLSVTRGIIVIREGQTSQLVIVFIFSVITWVTLLTIILIIENLKEQISLQTKLRRSEKLNVISQLAASVAHEVRNPLTTINGFLQLLEKEDNITEKQRNYIDISLEELARAQSIINDYLSLAKPNTKESSLIHLSREIEKINELMTSYTNIQNIIIQSSIEESLFVTGNRDEIKQVLINIIKNGIEAIGSNGTIRILAYMKYGKVYIEIIDNGVGMTEKQLLRLGTPFYSTKDVGTGVGLTLSFQIIELMKGKIEVESVPGQGTKFIIVLPSTVPMAEEITKLG